MSSSGAARALSEKGETISLDCCCVLIFLFVVPRTTVELLEASFRDVELSSLWEYIVAWHSTEHSRRVDWLWYHRWSMRRSRLIRCRPANEGKIRLELGCSSELPKVDCWLWVIDLTNRVIIRSVAVWLWRSLLFLFAHIVGDERCEVVLIFWSGVQPFENRRDRIAVGLKRSPSESHRSKRSHRLDSR